GDGRGVPCSRARGPELRRSQLVPLGLRGDSPVGQMVVVSEGSALERRGRPAVFAHRLLLPSCCLGRNVPHSVVWFVLTVRSPPVIQPEAQRAGFSYRISYRRDRTWPYLDGWERSVNPAPEHNWVKPVSSPKPGVAGSSPVAPVCRLRALAASTSSGAFSST